MFALICVFTYTSIEFVMQRTSSTKIKLSVTEIVRSSILLKFVLPFMAYIHHSCFIVGLISITVRIVACHARHKEAIWD